MEWPCDKCEITKINNKDYDTFCAECELIDEYYNWEEKQARKEKLKKGKKIVVENINNIDLV